MKKLLKNIISIALLTTFVSGCTHATVTDSKADEPAKTTSTEKNTKNTLKLTEVSERESFYITSDFEHVNTPFDLSLEEGYKNLEYKLYTYKDNSWQVLQQGKFELAGNNYWLLVSSHLDKPMITIRNCDLENYGTLQESSPLNELEQPSWWGEKGTSSNYCTIESISIVPDKEFAIIASRRCSGAESYNVNTDDFEHPENIEMHKEDEYFMLTFTFQSEKTNDQ